MHNRIATPNPLVAEPELKDYGRGLIDFPSLREGRVVLLCWQMGEGDQLEWWHEVEAGFAGRQPL